MRLGALLVPILCAGATVTAQAQDAAQRCAVSDDASERMTACRQALHDDSLDAYSHYNLGIVYMRANALDSAMAHWRAAAKIRPEYASPHAMIANLQSDRHQTAEAMAQADSAIQADPKNGLGYNAKARIFTSMSRFSDAVPLARQAVTLLPDDPLVRGNLAEVLGRTHQFDEAIAEAHKALALNGPPVLLYGLLGSIFLEQHQDEQALAAADSALAADSMQIQPHQVRLYALGRLHRTAEFQAAKARVERLFPEQKAMFEAMALTTGSSPTHAADVANALVAIDTGSDITVRMARAMALFRSGKKQEAVLAVRDFVRQHPDNAYGWSGLGYIDALSLHYTNALAEWKTAVALDPAVLNLNQSVKKMREEFLQITADPKAATIADLDAPIPPDQPVQSAKSPTQKIILLNPSPSHGHPTEVPANQ